MDEDRNTTDGKSHCDMTRVLVLSSLYPNPAYPVFGNFVRERVRRLAQVTSVLVLAPVRYRMFGSKAIPSEEARDGVRVLHPPFVVIPGVIKWSDGFLFALSIWRRFGRILREFKPDVIDAHWGYPDGFAAYILGRAYRLPVVVTVRGSDVNVFLKERLRGALLRYCLKRVDRVIAVSGALKAILETEGIPSDRIEVIKNGVDTSCLEPRDCDAARGELGLPRTGKMVLCVGNIVPIKGQDVLLEAFLQLQDEGALLVFVGDGEMRQGLVDRVRQLPATVAMRIHFAGSQPHDRIVQWLGAADVLCLPSRNEGLPNILLEALACGKPVVATRVGGVEEVITSPDLGIVVPSENPGMLAEALRSAICRDWDTSIIRSEAMRFSWDETVRQCLRVWCDVLRTREEHGRSIGCQ